MSFNSNEVSRAPSQALLAVIDLPSNQLLKSLRDSRDLTSLEGITRSKWLSKLNLNRMIMRIQSIVLTICAAVTCGCVEIAAAEPDRDAATSPSLVRPDRPTQPSLSVTATQLFANYFEERLKLFPLEATQAGDHRYDDQLPNDLTEAFRATKHDFFQRYLRAVRDLDPERLSHEERLSCGILISECEAALDSLRFPTHLMPINQFESLHLKIGQWAAGTGAQPFKTVKDYENWLKRLDGFAEWSHTAVTNMREGIKRGWVLPKALIRKTIPQMAAMARLPVENHLYYSPIRHMPETFSAADRARLSQAYSRTIQETIIPAFKELEEFLTREYLPAGRDSSGIAAIPLGSEFYRSQVKRFTTTAVSPDEIFELGQREVARIQGEMEKVKQSVGFKGELRSFFDHVRSRKELMPFTDALQVLERFHAIRESMSPSLTRLFRLKPKTPLEIRRTEAFREASASAEWVSGSLDGDRPAIFYVPIPEVHKYNVLQDEALFLHEAIPGHHYHLSLQRENKDLPMFRRVLDLSTFNEGWALYCESLGKELGLYSDPYQYFGMLSMEMHRAIRLVVDPGLHVKGWTREQAIQYSLEHEADSEEGIISEVERYMAWPGQAVAYKIGQLKILELRALAEQALGPAFEMRDFHDWILESGAMPLPLLEAKVNRSIAQKRARSTADTQHAPKAESSSLSPREGFIPVEGGPVWYRIFGGGRATPLLMVHGGPGGRSCTFEPSAQILSQDRPVILYDQLGTGRSGRPLDPTLWTVDRYVRELGQVRAALGLTNVHLLGHSWGTGLVVSYLQTAGFDGVQSATFLGPFFSTRIWLEDAQLLLAQLPADLQATVKRHEQAGTTQSKEYQEATEVFYSRFFYHKSNPPLPASCDESRRNDEIYQQMWGPTEFHATGTLRDFDVTDVLPRLRMPVLLVVGRFDEARSETAARFQGMMPDARLEIVEDCGHMVPVEDPAGLARIVREFLRERQRGR